MNTYDYDELGCYFNPSFTAPIGNTNTSKTTGDTDLQNFILSGIKILQTLKCSLLVFPIPVFLSTFSVKNVDVFNKKYWDN